MVYKCGCSSCLFSSDYVVDTLIDIVYLPSSSMIAFLSFFFFILPVYCTTVGLDGRICLEYEHPQLAKGAYPTTLAVSCSVNWP